MVTVFSGRVHVPGQHGGHALAPAGAQRRTDRAERQKVMTSSRRTSARQLGTLQNVVK